MIVAHGHPDFSKGGAEIAAYNLFKTLKEREDCEVLFLARHNLDKASHVSTPFGVRANDEVLFYSDSPDYFKFSQNNQRLIWFNFDQLLNSFKPTIVHFHHYVTLGLEMFRAVKNYNQNTKVILTLHEYLAICHHFGQMIKKDSGKLCYQATPADCHVCFPEISPQDFLLRKLYIQSFFNVVDLFISPSNFLRDRYIAWGVPEQKIVFLENGQVTAPKLPPRSGEGNEIHGRLAYFGQITQFKGLDVLLEAIALMSKKERKKIRLDIHGSGLEVQEKAFQNKIKKLLKMLNKQVTIHGPYQPDELPTLMQDIDWIIVPSIWWENSPLVIQEAFKFGRPIICSDIGGMAEKVTNNINGLHFRAGKAVSLRDTIIKATNDTNLYQRLIDNMGEVFSVKESSVCHLELYQFIDKNKAS